MRGDVRMYVDKDGTTRFMDLRTTLPNGQVIETPWREGYPFYTMRNAPPSREQLRQAEEHRENVRLALAANLAAVRPRPWLDLSGGK